MKIPISLQNCLVILRKNFIYKKVKNNKMKVIMMYFLKNATAVIACFAAKRVAFVAVAALIVCFSASAQQQGAVSAGGRLTMGAGDDYANFGVGAMVRYNVAKPLRLEVSGDYFLPNKDISMWDANLNAQWLFPVSERFVLYPLVGVNIMGMTGTAVNKYGFGVKNGFAPNFGVGADFWLNNKVALNFDAKYRVGFGEFDLDRLCISVGIVFNFLKSE